MNEARTRRERLEAREAELVAKIESRMTASEKAADRILTAPERKRAGGAWEPWEGTAV